MLATTVSPEDDALAAGGGGAWRVRAFAAAWTTCSIAFMPFSARILPTPSCASRPIARCSTQGSPVSWSRTTSRIGRTPDYVSNVEPPTFPDGLDTEIVSAAALDRAWREARLPSDREHVTTYIRTGTHGFRTRNVVHDTDLSSLRFTVDEPRDLDFVRAVHDELAPDGHRIFGMDEVLDLLRARPEIATLNAGIIRNEGLLRSRRRDLAATRVPDGGRHE